MAEYVKARLSAVNDGDRVTVTFTRGAAEVLLRFPSGGDLEAALNLGFLTDNLDELIDAANLEIEAAILRQGENASE